LNKKKAAKPFYITDTKQIRVLASAVRQDIVDALGVIGPCTMTDLAKFLGRTPDSLYYHVKVLQKVRLVEEAETHNSQGRAIPLYSVPGRPVFLRYKPAERANVVAVTRFAATTLRSANRGFARALAGGNVAVEGDERDLWVARWKGWLSKKDLREVNEHLARLILLLRDRSRADESVAELCELTFVLAPVRKRKN
jgi:DNA-binding transcriptional ArsR family regulator